MEKELFQLDRNGGQDKILKATYSPKAYRQRRREQETLSAAKIILSWIIILGVVFGAVYLAEKRSEIRVPALQRVDNIGKNSLHPVYINGIMHSMG